MCFAPESSYYGDVLTKAEREGRILDLPHRTDLRTLTGWDIGYSDDTVIVYVQENREWLDVVDCEGFTGLEVTGAISRLQAHGYVFRQHIAPHDIKHHSFAAKESPYEQALRLGVHFRVNENDNVQWGIDAVRRLFPRLRFDRRRCAKLLEALAGYSKVWDARGKVFRDAPLHSWHSHYSDAMRTFAVGYRQRPASEPRQRKENKTAFRFADYVGEQAAQRSASRPRNKTMQFGPR